MSSTQATSASIEHLLADWRTLLHTANESDQPADQIAEQKAYDALIDAVEARGLQYTQYDPRHAA